MMITMIPRHRTLALAALAGMATAAAAQVEVCRHEVACNVPGASGAYVLDEDGPLGYTMGSVSFTPDRRPVAIIVPYNGTDDANDPFGFAFDPTDCSNEDDWFLEKLDEAWDLGFRRFMIARPGGKLIDEGPDEDYERFTNAPQEGLQHLEAWHKKVYKTTIPSWITSKQLIEPSTHIELGVFIGTMQNNACNPCQHPYHGGANFDCSDTDETLTRHFDASIRESAELTYQNTYDWVNAGYDALWFDAASAINPYVPFSEDGEIPLYNGTDIAEADSIRAMNQNPDYAGIRVGGEAIPQLGGAYPRTPSSTHTTAAPWWAVHSYHAKNWDNGSGIVVDPTTTEIICAFQGHPENNNYPYSLESIAKFRDRGFVVTSYRDNAYKYIRRICDDDSFYNALAADSFQIADYNADGVIDCDDVDEFMIAYCENYNTSDADYAVYDGDIDNDDDVDMDDLYDFLVAHYLHSPNGGVGWSCTTGCP